MTSDAFIVIPKQLVTDALRLMQRHAMTRAAAYRALKAEHDEPGNQIAHLMPTELIIDATEEISH